MTERQLTPLLRQRRADRQPARRHRALARAGATGRLVYLETDPVRLQIELHNGCSRSIDFLARALRALHLRREPRHARRARCRRRTASASCRPASRSCSTSGAAGRGARSCASRRSATGASAWRDGALDGETYGWSKDEEWQQVPRPARRGPGRRSSWRSSGYEPADQRAARAARLARARRRSTSTTSTATATTSRTRRAEFTVAKDQNVRLRTGWFSDRSATYLAAGRPVITQDTGFGACCRPARACSRSRPSTTRSPRSRRSPPIPRASRAAAEIAREYFDAERVLRPLLEAVGVAVQRARDAPPRRSAGGSSGRDSTVVLGDDPALQVRAVAR